MKEEDKNKTHGGRPQDETKLKAEIGQRLKKVREKLGLTLARMGDICGISPSYISDFERGQKFPASRYMRELIYKHQVNLNHIYTGKGPLFIYSENGGNLPDFGKYNDELHELLQRMREDEGFMFYIFFILKDRGREEIADKKKLRHRRLHK